MHPESLESDLRAGRRKLLDDDGRFRFSCTSCGKCCFGSRIRLTPADVALMSGGTWARARGIGGTHDLHGRRLVERFLDPETRAPVCMIKVESDDSPCPFLVPDLEKAGPLPRMMVDREVAAGHHPVDAARRAGLSPARLLCGLHEDGSKPMVCKGAPIGRVHLDGVVGYIVEPPHPECPGMNRPDEWKVADWIRESKLENQYREVAWFSTFMESQKPRFPSMDPRRLAWIGEVLFNPDGVAMHFGVDPSGVPSRTLPLEALMRFVRTLAESFAGGGDENFADPAVLARRAGDVAARMAAARG